MQISRIARPSALFLALLLAAPSARAAKPLTNVTLDRGSYASVFDSNGTSGSLDGGELPYIFDGDPETSGKVRAGGLGAGSSIVVDFPLELLGDANHLVYADTVALNMVGNAKYSLFFSENGTDWEPVSGVERMTASSNAVHNVKDRVKSLKLVFDTLSGTVELFEFQVRGYVSSKPVNVVLNKSGLAAMYNPDGSMTANNGTGGFGGGSQLTWLFNGGKKTDGSWVSGITYMPGIGNGGWCLIDFSSVMPNGYFVNSIAITQGKDFKYSLYWSMDGTAWNPVDDAFQVSKVGTATYDVNKTAKYVKVFLDQSGGWDGNLSEIEVFAMDPDDVFCPHPSFTEWTAVEDSATCLLPGIDERFCTECGKRFTREQEAGLGHDYVSHLLIPGAYRKFGSGYIDCTRCDWRLDFPLDTNSLWDTMPLDLVTNRVDGTPIGRVSVKGQFNFTEITVTTTGNGADEPNPNNNWGVNPSALINNLWGWDWHDYWYSISFDSDPHVDYVFGTEIDLAWIDFSTDNANYTNRFFSVDDATGEETLIAEASAFTADETHREGVEAIAFTRVYFAPTEDATPDSDKTYYELEVVGEGADERAQWTPVSGLSAFEEGKSYCEASASGAVWCTGDGTNYVQIATPAVFTSDVNYYVQSATTEDNYYTESSGQYVSAGKRTTFAVNTTYYRTTGVTTGNDLPVIVDAHSKVTRLQLRFYRQPIKHLRLRQIKPDGKVRVPMYVSELHPWGTVAGAGDLQYRKETLMIFR